MRSSSHVTLPSLLPPSLFAAGLTFPFSRYLVMFRPPAREMCLNTLEDIYSTCEILSFFPGISHFEAFILTFLLQTRNLDPRLARFCPSGDRKLFNQRSQFPMVHRHSKRTHKLQPPRNHQVSGTKRSAQVRHRSTVIASLLSISKMSMKTNMRRMNQAWDVRFGMPN